MIGNNGNQAPQRPINYNVLKGLRLLREALKCFKNAEYQGSGIGELLARKTASSLWVFAKDTQYKEQ